MSVNLALTCLALLSAAASRSWASTWVSVEELGCDGPVERVVSLHSLDGAVWIGSQAGLYEIRGGACIEHEQPRAVRSMAHALSAIWAVSEDGSRLWRLREGAWTRYQGTVSSTSGKVVTGSPCYAPLIGSTQANPDVYDGIPWVRPAPMKLVSVDGAADLWLAYSEGSPHGVVRFGGDYLECWDDEITRADLSEAAAMADGEIWIVSLAPPLLGRYGGEGWTVAPLPITIAHLSVGLDGSVWAGGTSVYRLDGAIWRIVSDTSVQALAADHAGGVWAVDRYGEVLHIDHGANVTRYGKPDASEAPAKVPLAVGPDGAPCLGTQLGAYRLEGGGTAVGTRSWGETKREAAPSSP